MIWGFLCGICLWQVCRGAGRMLHPARALFGSALCGLCALSAVNMLGEATGLLLPISPASCLISGLLGVPGVILLLLVNLL